MDNVNLDSQHFEDFKNILKSKHRSNSDIESLEKSALQVLKFSINPNSTKNVSTEGLLYGLVQSGKTDVMTACAALAVDNGYKILIILTSDINPLYKQTLERVQSSFRGMRVIGKDDWRNVEQFGNFVHTSSVAIVCSKNWRKLGELLSSLKAVNAKSLPAFIIDDEADQASLNTYNSRAEEEKISRINASIREIRQLFDKKTFLQVTATPQALFLQTPGTDFRPSFTVLSDPGSSYVGGDDFFGTNKNELLRYVDLEEAEDLKEESGAEDVPIGLAKSLYTFFVGATSKSLINPDKGYSYLCHVSLRTTDHSHILDLIEKFREAVADDFDSGDFYKSRTYLGLKSAYDDLHATDVNLPSFEDILPKIKFFLGGASIKIVNSSRSGQEISTEKPFNIFIGGNKLGRGVTIENLLVSYYGRNPRRPNADTVLQHARMYGYRKDTKGVTRLFLPESLAVNFQSIHLMEETLRDSLRDNPQGDFHGILVTHPVRPTRSSVLNPNTIGYYVGGSNYNPYWPARFPQISEATQKIDRLLGEFPEKEAVDISFRLLDRLVNLIDLDERRPSFLWKKNYLKAVIKEMSTKEKDNSPCLVKVIRSSGRGIRAPRGETKGILTGGEKDLGKNNKLTIFMIRQPRISESQAEVWWPQIRFPDGRYFMAFSFS